MDRPVAVPPRQVARRAPGTASWRQIGALVSVLVLVPAVSWALGPAAPFVPAHAKGAAAAAAAPAGGAASVPESPQAAGQAAVSPLGAVSTATAPQADTVAGVRLGGGAPMALIDGQWWTPGGRPRGARLVSVTLQGAWLRHDDGRRQFLPLLPPPPGIALSRRASPPAAGTTAAAPAQPLTTSARP